jgi:hypothetical protein
MGTKLWTQLSIQNAWWNNQVTPIEKLVSLLFRYGGELIPIFVLFPWVSFGQSVVGDLPQCLSSRIAYSGLGFRV